MNVIAASYDSEGFDSHVDWAQRLYAEKFTRLQALKDEYDPTNLFRLNQNISPRGA